MIDWSYIKILGMVGFVTLGLQALLLFYHRKLSNGQQFYGSGPTLSQLLVEWLIYMVIFVVLSSMLLGALRWLCTYC